MDHCARHFFPFFFFADVANKSGRPAESPARLQLALYIDRAWLEVAGRVASRAGRGRAIPESSFLLSRAVTYGSSSPLTGVAGSGRPDSRSIGLSSVSRSRITASQDQRST
ncbi:hypothetical protein V5799_034194 [Amblyomma americanum]|uniref:Uncharacterized protein n=1 Tax=Amblyomma americanum TaxID=6943 RepID=A0AAQ4DL54_AMBAM